MTRYGEIPVPVLHRAEKRLTANKGLRYCAIDGCDQPATHSPYTSHDACEAHRLFPVQLVPDPARTMTALQAAVAGQRDHLAEEQLLTVRITYAWHPEWEAQTRRRAA